MTNPLLIVDSVTKRFGDIVALDDVSVTFERGEVIGLVGGNGAGKTTLLRLMCGVYKPSEGQVLFLDKEGVESPVAEVRKSLGVVPESTGLYHRLTAWENIRYHARLAGVPDDKAWARASRLADTLEISDSINRPTRGFSKGMRQKTALIRALSHDPDVILLDEPTSGLDVTSSRKVRALVTHLRDLGKTVIYSTHNLAEAQMVCNRIVIIHNGTIRANETPEQLLASTQTESLEDAFVALTPDASREVSDSEEDGWFQTKWLKFLTTFGKAPSRHITEERGDDD